MKKLLLVTVLLLKAWLALAQSDDMLFYYPDGKPYKRACKNIADINGDFDKDGRIKTFSPLCWDSTRYDCFVVIGYKFLSDLGSSLREDFSRRFNLKVPSNAC